VEREAFLKRVSASAMVATLPRPPEVSERLPDLDPVDLVGLFRARAHEEAVVIHGPVGRHSVPRAVEGIAAGHACQTYMAWDDLPVPGVTGALTGAGVNRVEHRVSEEGRISHQLEYQTLDLGVTGADAGLADDVHVPPPVVGFNTKSSAFIPKISFGEEHYFVIMVMIVRHILWCSSRDRSAFPGKGEWRFATFRLSLLNERRLHNHLGEVEKRRQLFSVQHVSGRADKRISPTVRGHNIRLPGMLSLIGSK